MRDIAEKASGVLRPLSSVPSQDELRLWHLAFPCALVAVCSFLSFFLYLGAIPLTSPNEGLYAETAREMLETGDAIIPRADGVIYLEKPPLLYWLVAGSMKVLGQTAFAARLPSAIAALATALLLFLAGRRLGPRGAGVFSAIAFATSIGLIIVARQVLFDALLTLCTAAALLLFWFATEPIASSRARRLMLPGCYAALALAALTKGLVGIALPVLVVGAYVLLSGDWERLRRAWSAAGFLLFLAIAVPWHVAAQLRQKQFAWFYFVNEHWLRFLGRRRPPDFHEDPIFSPLLSLVLLTLPWGFFLPAAVRSELAAGKERRPSSETLFLLCWSVVPALFFTLSRTRTYYYQLPAVPALALLVGRLGARLRVRREDSTRERWLLAPAIVLAALVFGVWIFAGFGSWGSLRNAAWHALGFSCGLWLAAGLAVAAALIALRLERVAFAVVAVSVCLTVAAALRFAAASPQPVFRSEEPAAKLIVGLSPPEGTLVAVEGKFENHSSLAFYLPRRLRPVVVVDALGQGDLAFGSTLENTGGTFVWSWQMLKLVDKRELIYLTLSPSKVLVPPRLKLITCDDEISLWTNLGQGIAEK